MNKLFLVILALMLTNVSAHAVMVKYGNTGNPVAVVNSYGVPVPLTQIPNAYTYQRPYYRNNGIYNRHYNTYPYNYNYYGRRVAQPAHPARVARPVKPISRLSKDYRITPRSSYTRNGITYYN